MTRPALGRLACLMRSAVCECDLVQECKVPVKDVTHVTCV